MQFLFGGGGPAKPCKLSEPSRLFVLAMCDATLPRILSLSQARLRSEEFRIDRFLSGQVGGTPKQGIDQRKFRLSFRATATN